MQIEIKKDVLTFLGLLKKGDTLEVSQDFARRLVKAKIAKVRKAPKKTEKKE
jgi:hypothetical protein